MVTSDLLLDARSLRRIFGHGASARAALKGVDLQVQRGAFLTVFGPSGSGKSTLLSILGGLDQGFDGELRLFGSDVRCLSDRALSCLRGREIGFVFQAFHLLDNLSVLDNVLVPSLFAARRRPRDEARGALARVGLADRANDRAVQLSGGQRQRVAIARAIVHHPQLLLCDEPTGNLDRDTATQVIEIFSSLNRERNVTLVCATHDVRIAHASTCTMELIDGAWGSRGEVSEDG
jgi:putative ABC transport system ATP-binding protein